MTREEQLDRAYGKLEKAEKLFIEAAAIFDPTGVEGVTIKDAIENAQELIVMELAEIEEDQEEEQIHIQAYIEDAITVEQTMRRYLDG